MAVVFNVIIDGIYDATSGITGLPRILLVLALFLIMMSIVFKMVNMCRHRSAGRGNSSILRLGGMGNFWGPFKATMKGMKYAGKKVAGVLGEGAEKEEEALVITVERNAELLAELNRLPGALDVFLTSSDVDLDKLRKNNQELVRSLEGISHNDPGKRDEAFKGRISGFLKSVGQHVSMMQAEFSERKNAVDAVVGSLAEIIKAIKKVLSWVKIEQKDISKYDKMGKRDFSRDISLLEDNLKTKEAMLKGEKQASGDSSMLDKEIAELKQKIGFANTLKQKFDLICDVLRQRVGQANNKLKAMMMLEKNLVHYEGNKLVGDGHRIEVLFNEIESMSKSLEGEIQKLSSNPADLSAAFAVTPKLNALVGRMNKASIFSGRFDRALKYVPEKGYVLARLVSDYIKIMEIVTALSEQVDQAELAMDKILSTTEGMNAAQITASDVHDALSQMTKILEQEKNVEKYLETMAASTGRKLDAYKEKLEKLAGADDQLAGALLVFSESLSRFERIYEQKSSAAGTRERNEEQEDLEQLRPAA
ncbi:hypothetical protein JW868_03225 [Candidatus Woesearchaeota archaeon]|nr:hypothetical protein [Candidatus Woesearchaeota archaeon]